MVDECVPLQYLLHGVGDGPVPLCQARPCHKHRGPKGDAAQQKVWKYTKLYSIEKYVGMSRDQLGALVAFTPSFRLGNCNLIFGGRQNQAQASQYFDWRHNVFFIEM